MNSQLVCFYHSHKNCFAYVDSKYKRQNSNNEVFNQESNQNTVKCSKKTFILFNLFIKVAVEIVSNDERSIYLSLLFVDNLENRNRKSSLQSIYLNSLYAKQLAIKEQEEVQF
jgi:hypothetical protein